MTWEEFKNGLTEIEKPLVEVYRDLLLEISPAKVLEVGSGWGLFARSVIEWTRAELTTVDKIPADKLVDFNKRLAGFEGRIERLTGDSRELMPSLVSAGRTFDLAFVDGDHGFEGAQADLRHAWNLAPVVLLDDVFHKENWVSVNGDSRFNYGVARALWSLLQGAAVEARIIPVGKGGLALIKKRG